MKSAIPKFLTVLMVALVAVVGSIGGRLAWEAVTAEEEQVARPPALDLINEEATKPKFEGEILGIFIGPHGARIPDKFESHEDICGDTLTTEVDDSNGGDLNLSIDLPDSFRLDSESLNTGVIACGDIVYAARWEYQAPQTSGILGRMVISRSIFKYTERDVSNGRIRVVEIGGLPAILIEPLADNGIGSQAGVIFPGEVVTTEIQSSDIPRADLMKVAEIVAAAILKVN